MSEGWESIPPVPDEWLKIMDDVREAYRDSNTCMVTQRGKVLWRALNYLIQVNTNLEARLRQLESNGRKEEWPPRTLKG